MSERFFSPQPITADRVKLDGPEAHHLMHVMRAAVGDSVMLFDGGGAEFAAVVESLGRSEAGLRVVERREIDRELPYQLAVGVALPKGDRQKWLVEKLTELGVTMLVPLITDRGVAQPTSSALERVARSVIEAAKQCGRNRLMKIAAPQPWHEWLSQQSPAGNSRSPEIRRLLANSSGLPFSQLQITAPIQTQLAIGPEGGFTDAELEAAAAAGWRSVSLGPRILRVETAAVALTAAIALSGETAV